MTTKHEKELEAQREARQEAKEAKAAQAEQANAAAVTTDDLTAALTELVKLREAAGDRDHPAVVTGRGLLDRLKPRDSDGE